MEHAARRATLAAVAVLMLAAPPGAPAQAPGVHVDPDSPAAKEYAIPLDEARRTAGGDEPAAAPATAPPEAATPAPTPALFGEGVEREKPDAGGAPAGGGTSGTGGGGTPATSGDPPPAVPAAGGVDSSGTAWTVLIALGVLGLGAGAAFAARRLPRRLSRS